MAEPHCVFVPAARAAGCDLSVLLGDKHRSVKQRLFKDIENTDCTSNLSQFYEKTEYLKNSDISTGGGEAGKANKTENKGANIIGDV